MRGRRTRGNDPGCPLPDLAMHWIPYLAVILRSHRWSEPRLARFRDRRFRDAVRSAAERVPFYADLLREHGIDAASVRGTADRVRLPIVTRDALRDAGRDGWARGIPARARRMTSTSGSSGNPLIIQGRIGERIVYHAGNLQAMMRYGWRPWSRAMALGSNAIPHDTRIQALGFCRWRWIDPTRPVGEWVDEYERLRPRALHSYPSALREFCVEARARGGLRWLPRSLSTGGELLSEEIVPLVEEVFGRRPMAMYGAMETGRMAFECDAHDGLHVRMDIVDLEILDDDGRPVPPGTDGIVHVTSFPNLSMPFVRYRLGDVAAWVDGPCRCGLRWPRIRIDQGRGTDVIDLPGGRRVPITTLAGVVGGCPSIRQYQFVDRGNGESRRLVLRAIPLATPVDGLDTIAERLRGMAPGIPVDVELVDTLPRTASGKVSRYRTEPEP